MNGLLDYIDLSKKKDDLLDLLIVKYIHLYCCVTPFLFIQIELLFLYA